MSTIYTPEMIAKFKALTDDFEMAIRKDERDRIVSKMRGNLFAEQTASPLPESGLQPDDVVRVELNASQRKMLSYLRDGFMAVPTLAGHLNIQKQSVYAYLDGIKRAGYELEVRNTGSLKGGYRNIYRLAKSA